MLSLLSSLPLSSQPLALRPALRTVPDTQMIGGSGFAQDRSQRATQASQKQLHMMYLIQCVGILYSCRLSVETCLKTDSELEHQVSSLLK